MDIYPWGACVAVTGQAHDTGQHVLKSYFQKGSCSSLSYFQLFFLIAFLGEACIMNTIILLSIHYTITITLRINNNAIINNHVKLQDLILLFNIATSMRKSSFEIYRQFGHVPSERFVSPVSDLWWSRRELCIYHTVCNYKQVHSFPLKRWRSEFCWYWISFS
jgi:hypothetical protein